MEHNEFLQVIISPFHFATCDAVLRGCKIVDISKPLQWRRLSKKVRSPLGPSARGLRPQAVGERTVRLPEIFRVQTVKKMYFCLVACVGATIGRPPAYRSNAFSGTVSCKANGHGRAMLAPTRVFRQSVAAPHFRCPLCRTGVYFSLLTKAVSICYLVIG